MDVVNHTAFHYHATAGRPRQTVLAEKQTLLTFYSNLIVEHAAELLLLSAYLAVDAYFAKYEFIQTVSKTGLKVITRLRNDAALWYSYVVPKRAGKGLPQQFAGKVEGKNLDPQYFRRCIQEEDWTAYEAYLYSKSLKRMLKVVIVHTYQTDSSIKTSKLFASTDTTLTGIDLWYYYHLRFQPPGGPAEFLYRDAKQLLGLAHCQSCQQDRLSRPAARFHFNFSLTLLSLAKVAHWLTKPVVERGSFSLQDIKTSPISTTICSIHLLKGSDFAP